MRFIGKPEVLNDAFLFQIADDTRQGTVLTDEEIQSLLPTDLVLQPGEARLGLFAIRLDLFELSDLKKMRKVFPRHEYSLTKNKMRARKLRKVKRNTIEQLVASNATLKAENKKLKYQLRLSLQKLQTVSKSDVSQHYTDDLKSLISSNDINGDEMTVQFNVNSDDEQLVESSQTQNSTSQKSLQATTIDTKVKGEPPSLGNPSTSAYMLRRPSAPLNLYIGGNCRL